MKRSDARVRYTQMVLKESLLSLLKEKPINKITVKELCDLAELNRATFYSHYRDCYDLMEHIENELLEAFRQALELAKTFDVTGLIDAIYNIIETHETACQVLVFGGASPSVLRQMIDLARDRTIRMWQKQLPGASEAEIEMLYIHLSNGLMHVVVDGYGKYSRQTVVSFVNRIVGSSLSLYQG